MMNYVLKEDLQYIADYNLPYKKLKGKSVLVTGATGLIGTSLVRALLAIGDIKVIAFVRNEEKAKKIYKDFLEGSLFFHVADIVKEIEIDEININSNSSDIRQKTKVQISCVYFVNGSIWCI